MSIIWTPFPILIARGEKNRWITLWRNFKNIVAGALHNPYKIFSILLIVTNSKWLEKSRKAYPFAGTKLTKSTHASNFPLCSVLKTARCCWVQKFCKHVPHNETNLNYISCSSYTCARWLHKKKSTFCLNPLETVENYFSEFSFSLNYKRMWANLCSHNSTGRI